ncbi:MAG: hypothetical protein WCO30_01025 [bacterium]
MKKTLKQKNKNGFAILFAILLASLLLEIGLSIYNISVKELVISSFETEVKKAVYAASAGFECVNYWEGNGGKMGTSTSNDNDFTDGIIKCGAGFDLTTPSRKPVNKAYDVTSAAANIEYVTEFWMFLESDSEGKADPYGPCVHTKYVNIKKDHNPTPEEIDEGYSYSITTVTVRGYNSCDLTDKRTVEKEYEFQLR